MKKSIKYQSIDGRVDVYIKNQRFIISGLGDFDTITFNYYDDCDYNNFNVLPHQNKQRSQSKINGKNSRWC